MLAVSVLLIGRAVAGQYPVLPDSELTPGDALPVTISDICRPGYAKKVRHVPAEMKRKVYQEYGIKVHVAGDYEVDHLIPRFRGRREVRPSMGQHREREVLEARIAILW
jgi:hypothetical protein